MTRSFLLLSCEHASNAVPYEYRWAFQDAKHILSTHRGFDIGALALAKRFHRDWGGSLLVGAYTRLLCDLNRSKSNRNCFSEYSRRLSLQQRSNLITQYYDPYHLEMARVIRQGIRAKSQVFHLSIHSFTPHLNGKTRNADLGILYNPARSREKFIALFLKRNLQQQYPHFRVRCNYPYRGTGDNAISAYRKKFSKHRYVGIELEFNQGLKTEFARIYKQMEPIFRRAVEALEKKWMDFE